jgi:hypothetical protein
MKNIFLLLFVSIGLLTSCVENPEEDPEPLPPAGNVTATIGDQTFSSTSSQVVIDNISMSLKATQADGSYFKITLPESPIIGTYTWSVFDPIDEGFSLAYYENDGAVPYVAARDNIGDFAAFPSYIDTAELIIYSIDRVNKRVTGSFRFTGVRFTDDTQTAIETRLFENGQFLNLPYTTAAVVDPVNTTVRVKKITDTDADGTVSTTEYFYTGNKISYLVDSDGIRVNYFYEGDLIVREESYQGTELVEKVFYTYDGSSNLVTYISLDLVDDIGSRITYVHNSNGTISFQEYSGDTTTQEDLENNGTISNTRYIENGINPITSEPQVFTNTFTYDTKNNPFKNVVGYSKIYFADSFEALNFNNNLLSHSEQIDSDAPYVFETLTYTYNAGNYPTKIIHNDGSGMENYTEDIIYY